MAFYYLNRIDPGTSKKKIEALCRQYGTLKFVGSFRDDTRNSGYRVTIAEFVSIEDTKAFEKACKERGMIPIMRKERNEQGRSGADRSQSRQQNPSRSHHANTPQREGSSQHPHTTPTIHNPSFYFYKDDAYGKEIERYVWSDTFVSLFEIPHSKKFTLQTIYPGLLVGSGYNHPKLKDDKEGFQLGFFFDHTTGQPLIPGSSIKGVLRHVLENYRGMYGDVDIEAVFDKGGMRFYDAYITGTEDGDGRIFGGDYITSHFSDQEGGAFKAPNPIRFLKILPGVSFCFQFGLGDERYAGYIEIFRQILLDFGVGAKSNVGYGQFVEG
jgi:CRISPR-associated protein Cmr6